MIYVGIDIAKETHVVAAVNTDVVILLEPFAFQNNHDGFQLLKTNLDSLNKNDLIIGLESTRSLCGKCDLFSFIHRDTGLLLSILFRPPLCGKQAFAKPRPIKLILYLSAKQ